jgi:hypothetical protein
MTDSEIIPININERLTHFEKEVKVKFSFLVDYGYILKSLLKGRTENFLDYFCKFDFEKEDTSIRIYYSTDILNGNLIAFPQEKERPLTDNNISCFISDKNAFLSVGQFAETIVQKPKDAFWINMEASDIQMEISRVVKNYNQFFQDHLMDVIRQEKMYDCYTDRFYDKVFKEIHYR